MSRTITNSTFNFDLAIVGGGPAGTAAAITAARMGAQVVVFEAGDFPRQKVCGEFVSAESLEALHELLRDVPEAASVLQAAPTIDGVRLYVAGQRIESRVSPPALSIPRYELDRLLWLAAQRAGAVTRPGCEVLSVAGTGPFLLTTAAGEIHTNCVIVAAGRWSRFRPDLAIPDGSKWIGVKAHFREDGARKSTDLYFFDHGYCGVQPVADGVVNACAMVRSDRARSLAEALQLHPALAERSRAWQPLTEPVSTAPLIYREPEPVRENQAFVGDAAAFIDPFVGDGISIALRTGRVAGKLLSKGCESPRGLDTAITSYRREYEEQFAPLVHSASRIRRALSVPSVLLRAGSLLLRVPGVIPYMIRKTRQVS